MELIAISKNVLVNPEQIALIQQSGSGSKMSVTIMVGGRTMKVTENPQDFLRAVLTGGAGGRQTTHV